MNLSELKDRTDPKTFEASCAFYQTMFSTLTTNHLMYEMGMCPKLIMDMDRHDYDRFVKIVTETAQILGH